MRNGFMFDIVETGSPINFFRSCTEYGDEIDVPIKLDGKLTPAWRFSDRPTESRINLMSIEEIKPLEYPTFSAKITSFKTPWWKLRSFCEEKDLYSVEFVRTGTKKVTYLRMPSGPKFVDQDCAEILQAVQECMEEMGKGRAEDER